MPLGTDVSWARPRHAQPKVTHRSAHHALSELLSETQLVLALPQNHLQARVKGLPPAGTVGVDILVLSALRVKRDLTGIGEAGAAVRRLGQTRRFGRDRRHSRGGATETERGLLRRRDAAAIAVICRAGVAKTCVDKLCDADIPTIDQSVSDGSAECRYQSRAAATGGRVGAMRQTILKANYSSRLCRLLFDRHATMVLSARLGELS